MRKILRFIIHYPLYSTVQQQCLLAAQLHYLQAYLTASSQHQQQQFTGVVGSLSQHVVERAAGKEFPSDGRVVFPPDGENQESPRSNVNAVSVPYTLYSLKYDYENSILLCGFRYSVMYLIVR